MAPERGCLYSGNQETERGLDKWAQPLLSLHYNAHALSIKAEHVKTNPSTQVLTRATQCAYLSNMKTNKQTKKKVKRNPSAIPREPLEAGWKPKSYKMDAVSLSIIDKVMAKRRISAIKVIREGLLLVKEREGIK